MFRSPHLAEAVSRAALFAICTSFSLTADGTPKKTKPTGSAMCSGANTANGRKAKEKKATFATKLRPLMTITIRKVVLTIIEYYDYYNGYDNYIIL